MTASWRGERGPTRPANAPSRLATNGAAASAAGRAVRARRVGRSSAAGRDERHAHADADGRDEVEREVAPDRALMRRWSWNDGRNTDVPRSGPLGLRGELSGSALGSPSRRSAICPGRVGPPSSDEEVRPRANRTSAGRSTVDGRSSGQRAAVRYAWPGATSRGSIVVNPNRRSVLWGCVVSTGPGYRGTRAEDAAQASLIRRQKEVPGNRQSTLALAA